MKIRTLLALSLVVFGLTSGLDTASAALITQVRSLAYDDGASNVVGTNALSFANAFDSTMTAIQRIDFESAPAGDFSLSGPLALDANVTATLFGTDPAGFGPPQNDPGIASIDNDSTRGFNTTSGGSQHLRVVSNDPGTVDGGVILSFASNIRTFGFFLMGREDTKRDIFMEIIFGNGDPMQAFLSETGPNGFPGGGGIQFIGFSSDTDVAQIIIRESASITAGRDIFGIDDIRYSFTESDLTGLGEPVPAPGSAVLIALGLIGLRRLTAV
ncbi:MAG: hypothetical protein H6980_00475 [Gammaproteobacteria bacterium]|nr:hypothetical protein [Gammaproteobacteria bacterium]